MDYYAIPDTIFPHTRRQYGVVDATGGYRQGNRIRGSFAQ